ncbi:MAG TPA: IS3 family transposase, partial [Gammaproteobacteria bacterium]|nr:IS3 family transposase [Gammaproteobacteria bacterium]
MCSGVCQSWAAKHKIRGMFIQPGKPTQNAYVERLNRTVRYKWLGEHIFESIEHAPQTATQWLW